VKCYYLCTVVDFCTGTPFTPFTQAKLSGTLHHTHTHINTHTCAHTRLHAHTLTHAAAVGTGKTQLAHSLLGGDTWPVVDPIMGASKKVTVLKVSCLMASTNLILNLICTSPCVILGKVSCLTASTNLILNLICTSPCVSPWQGQLSNG
jgi:hypothetical protein